MPSAVLHCCLEPINYVQTSLFRACATLLTINTASHCMRAQEDSFESIMEWGSFCEKRDALELRLCIAAKVCTTMY
jgi:hypothetical protein